MQINKNMYCLIITMDINVLGALLKRVNNFNVKSFDGRVIFQKTVYFMQEFSVDLGYDFNWYVAGPYSSDLSGDGFKLQIVYNKSPNFEFAESNLKEEFNKFMEFINPIKNDRRKLELYSSIHFLLKLGLNGEKIKKFVGSKKEPFSEKEIEDGIEYLKSVQLLWQK